MKKSFMNTGGTNKPEREEKIIFHLDFRGDQLDANRDKIKKLLKKGEKIPPICESDTYSVEYDINFNYYNVIDQLNTIIELRQQNGFCLNFDYKVLNHQKSLMIEVIKLIDKLDE